MASHAFEQRLTCDIFICQIKTVAPVFQQMLLSHKIRANVLYTSKLKRSQKRCHIKFALVDAALAFHSNFVMLEKN